MSIDSELQRHISGLLSYNFRNTPLLDLAFTHRSFGKEHNERLEFLGDALLGLFIADALFAKFPEATESDLTRLRAALVKKQTLAGLASQLDLGRHLRLGLGEHKSAGWRKQSLLANSMEALVGAVYLDSDLEQCRSFVQTLFSRLLAELTVENIPKDPKSRLQEYLQANKKPLPSYQVVAETGVAHDRLFTIECHVEGIAKPVRASGKNKRDAEQAAADAALEIIAPDAG